MSKIIDILELEKYRGCSKSDIKIGFTNGCFDIVHLGHLEYLSNCKQYVDILVVGINTDQSIKRLKGKNRPINILENRLKFLSHFESIDFLVPFDELTPIRLITILRPDYLFKGADYNKKDIVGASFVESNKGQVKVIPFLEGFSTSNLIKEINKRYD